MIGHETAAEALAQTRKPSADIRLLSEVMIHAQHQWLAHKRLPAHEWCETCRLTTERYYRAYCERANAINAWLKGVVIRVDVVLCR